MQHYTPNDMTGPSEATLFIIRAIAYAYNDSRRQGCRREVLLN